MRIPQYSAKLYDGETVAIGGDDEYEPLEVSPPSETDVAAGFMDGITAAETVELHRALSAWLGMHKRLHPDWHRQYRKDDPGGLTPAGKARKAARIEAAKQRREEQ